MTESAFKSCAASEPSIESKVSSFLGAYKNGLRDPDATVQNLSNVYKTLSEKDRKRFYEFLVSAYEREPLSGGRAGNLFVSIPSVILRTIIEFGPVAEFIPRMFDHLLSLKPEGIEEWANNVFPVFQYNLFHSSDRFDDGTLDLIKEFPGRLSRLGGQGEAFPLRLIEVAKDLERVVADINLRKLESTTRESGALAGKSTKKGKLDYRPLNMSMAISGAQNPWLGIRSEYGISGPTFGKRISFVKNEFKRSVIFRDVEHAYLLANHGFHKSAVILAGGVIEELLRLYLESRGVPPQSNNLDSYIKTCETSGFIKGANPKLADAVRQFRNIVHLEKEVSSKHTISQAAAKGAVASIFTITSELAT
jgi:hypothetical protein